MLEKQQCTHRLSYVSVYKLCFIKKVSISPTTTKKDKTKQNTKNSNDIQII